MKRILIDLVLVLCIFVAPWWLTLGAAIVVAILIPKFIELPVLALCMDSFTSAPIERFYYFQFTLTLISLIAYCLIVWVKMNIRVAQ